MPQHGVAPARPSARLGDTDEPRPSQEASSGTAVLLSFARDLVALSAQLDQGAAPDLYKRLIVYQDALRVAQVVVAAFQEQRTGDGGDNR